MRLQDSLVKGRISREDPQDLEEGCRPTVTSAVTGGPSETDIQRDHGSRKRGFAQRNADHRSLRNRLGDEVEELRKRGRKLCEEASERSEVLRTKAIGRQLGVLPPSLHRWMNASLNPRPTVEREDRKRRASKEAFNEFGPEGHGADERKGPRVDAIEVLEEDGLGIEVNNLVMSRLELEETKAVGVRTDDYCKPVMPMTILEESLDFSWMENEDARFVGEMMACTDVGPVRDQLGRRLVQSLVEEFVDPAVNDQL